jgi:hypothetical protein
VWVSQIFLVIKVRSRKWTWHFYGAVKRENCCWFPFLFPKCVGHKGMWEWKNDDVCKDEGWCYGHHEKLREVGKEGGWIIMKKQALEDAI